MDNRKKPVIGITIGDPYGIGPEIAIKASINNKVRSICEPVLFGSIKTLDETARAIGLNLSNTLVYSTPRFIQKTVFGIISGNAGKEAIAALHAALLKISTKEISAIVTSPLSKEAVVKAGYKNFTGHTEYLADFGGNPPHCLALYSKSKAIAFSTCHVSVKEALKLNKKQRIVVVGHLLDEFLQKVLKIKGPRIAISGLNPHAGENGMFGDEEKKEVMPAINDLLKAGINAKGPIPPDVVFPALFAGRYDGVVSLLHDHGHVAFKTAMFRPGHDGLETSGVNVTLGLPFIRTSADHGTAFDIAGKGIANPGSLIDAIELAVKLLK